MTIRFAAARSTVHSPIARALARRAHGMGAAKVALGEADKAHANGDMQGRDWWMDICRTLDRRIAANAGRRF